jgi:hypothetical protein
MILVFCKCVLLVVHTVHLMFIGCDPRDLYGCRVGFKRRIC